jgi:hypothetical protein
MNTLPAVGQDIPVNIVTFYGLDGPEIESQWGLDFPHLRRLALRPTQPPVQWVPCLFTQGRDIDLPLPSNASVKERVELCLYCPFWAFMACFRVHFTISVHSSAGSLLNFVCTNVITPDLTYDGDYQVPLILDDKD